MEELKTTFVPHDLHFRDVVKTKVEEMNDDVDKTLRIMDQVRIWSLDDDLRLRYVSELKYTHTHRVLDTITYKMQL